MSDSLLIVATFCDTELCYNDYHVKYGKNELVISFDRHCHEAHRAIIHITSIWLEKENFI